VKLHLVYAFERLKRTDQHPASNVQGFRGDIEHEMIAVGEVDVGVAAAEKHRAIARGGPSKMMGGGIARRIGFGFDDAADKLAGWEFANHHLADEETGEGDGPSGQLGAAEASNQDASSAAIHNGLRLSLDAAKIKS
jgi:hypothetical protein